jgi:magnesium-transporting ATPase (P-type)
MDQPPRSPDARVLNRSTTPRWVLFGIAQAVVGLMPFIAALGSNNQKVEQTMVFAIMCVSTIVLAASVRRDLIPGWVGPYVPYFLWLLIPLVGSILAVETELLRGWLDTVSLTGGQWAWVFGLSLVPAVVIEADKAFRRSRSGA